MWCSRNDGELELAKEAITLRELAVTFEDLDDTTYCFSVAVEKLERSYQCSYTMQPRVSLHLGLLGRDHSGVADELEHNTTSGLNTDGQRTIVSKDNIHRAFFTSEDATLNCSTIKDGLIGVDALRQLLLEALLEELLNFGSVRGTLTRTDPPTSSFVTPASLRTCSTGFIDWRERSS